MPKISGRTLSRRTAIGALSIAALSLVAAAPAAPAPAWSSKISTSAIGAYIVGNPAAKVRLVEYFSYTCSHCGEFARDGDIPLKTQYIDKGLVVFEYRNLVRDPVDLTAALLARCGGAKTFAANHHAIFMAQPVWLAKVQKAPEAMVKSWYVGTESERARKIAADTGLGALMAKRGYTQAQMNACFDSEVTRAELEGMTNIGLGADHVRGTPAFFINGRHVDVTVWSAIKTQLDAALKAS